MTDHHLTAWAEDTMGADDSDTHTIASTASAPMRTVRRSFFENRIVWGNAIDSTVHGPTFSDVSMPGSIDGRTCPPDDVTVSTIFQVLEPVTFVALRVYKAPNHVGTTVPFTLWEADTPIVSVTSTGTVLGTESVGPWVVDDGGWQEIEFTTPIDLLPDTTYVLGMYAEDGIFAWSPNVWEAQDTVVWPLVNPCLQYSSVIGYSQGSMNSSWNTAAPDGATLFPRHTGGNACNYYLDPIVEWEEPLPAYEGGLEYHEQWAVPHTRHAFPFAVFFSDPEYLVEYYDAGVNTLMAGSPVAGTNAQSYIDAMALTGTGNSMDWWPAISIDQATLTFNPAQELLLAMDEYPDMADQIVGYLLWDEPDMSGTYRTPELMKTWRDAVRSRDSTRPFYFTFGLWAARNQGFGWSPSGATPQTVNELWRTWSELADVLACDDYQFVATNSPGAAGGYGGVWCYAAQVKRMQEITDGRKPIWAVVESTSQVGDSTPTPANFTKSCWAAIIAGARGIILFDHRFPSDLVTQDFAHMLHNPPMLAAVTALSTQLQTLGPALLGEDTGLVTAYTTSNMTEGPLGGTYGVPIHYRSGLDGATEYVFAQAIRPGATTATLTIPSWAGETVTVVGEARTEIVDGSGVLTDTFAADYQVHIYQL